MVRTVLWLDCRLVPDGGPLACEDLLLPGCQIAPCRAYGQEAVFDAISRERPAVIVFEYDYPDPVGLSELQQTKRTHPSVPVVMLTEQHCESLAVWAFRSGARDYMTKPVSAKELASQLGTIVSQLAGPGGAGQWPRANWMERPPLPPEARVCTRVARRKETATVHRYVQSHLHDRIRLEDMARLCEMNLFQFSRVFKAEHGLTFRDYLLQTRVHRAVELLRNPVASVGDIAHATGFRDPPYFARMFRKVMGMSPTEYRDRLAAGRAPAIASLPVGTDLSVSKALPPEH